MREDEPRGSETTLSLSLSKSINEEALSSLSGIAEVGLDSIFEEGFLKDISILATVASVYRIGKSVRERHHLKNFAIFLDELNTVDDSPEFQDRYKQYFSSGDRDKEIEYLIIILDRFAESEKAVFLARLYAGYINRHLGWDDFRMYANIIDRILPGDYEMLKSQRYFSLNRFLPTDKKNWERLPRLAGLGLVDRRSTQFDDKGNGTLAISSGDAYFVTDFGSLFVSIIEKRF